MPFWNPPAYQDGTNTRKVSTPAWRGRAESLSQSTGAPSAWRCRQTAAKLADLKAMVTPLEKTGARNSPALPSKAKPLPHSDVTLAEYPVMQRAGVSHDALASRLRRPGAWPH